MNLMYLGFGMKDKVSWWHSVSTYYKKNILQVPFRGLTYNVYVKILQKNRAIVYIYEWIMKISKKD